MNTSFLSSTLPCSASSIAYPILPGAEILSLSTNLITNYTSYIHNGYYANHGAVNITNLTYCNVSITYTHPGQNDSINVQVFLAQDTWNGRMQHIGGAGWQAGLHYAGIQGMLAAAGEGYAAIGTNAGPGDAVSAGEWALVSEGNVDLYLLEDLMTRSLYDASVIGKAVVGSYYGKAPSHSYFSGCSQGGRQGLMLAQRYLDAYNGIAASAPAINWSELFVGDFYGTVLMNELGVYPAPCEFDAITDAILKACDGIDGVVDGVIADPEFCDFDPNSVVGTLVNCTDTGNMVNVSNAAAYIAQAIFTGPRKTDGTFLWHGIEKGAGLTADTSGGLSPSSVSLAATTCANGTCSAVSPYLMTDWIKYFILRNASADVSSITRKDFENIFHASLRQYSNIESNDPDLTAFRDLGGKMISYHGLADLIITPRSTTSYYDAVTSIDSNVHDFYRIFLAPGISHCFGGNGAYPDGTFDAMRKWVEEGIAPEVLNATSVGENVIERTLCPYPKKQYYGGNNTEVVSGGEGFYCK